MGVTALLLVPSPEKHCAGKAYQNLCNRKGRPYAGKSGQGGQQKSERNNQDEPSQQGNNVGRKRGVSGSKKYRHDNVTSCKNTAGEVNPQSDDGNVLQEDILFAVKYRGNDIRTEKYCGINGTAATVSRA